MDLVLLIVIFIGGIMLFYLTETIRSLHKEIREIKLKCINTQYNGNPSSFVENTENTNIKITENMLNFLGNLKNFF